MDTSFERFATEYDQTIGDTGDYTHQNTIDPALFELIGNPSGLVCYDVACGNGYIARRLAKQQAREVVASDISPTLINLAKTKYSPEGIQYLLRDAADFSDLQKNYFDLVIMNMAFFYITDVPIFVQGIKQILKPGGRFLFSLDHPLKYAAYRAFGLDHIDVEAEHEKYLNVRVEKNYNHWTKKQNDLDIYVRPLSFYLNACGQHGLLTKTLREPPTKAQYQGKDVTTNIPFKVVVETIKADPAQ